MSMFPKHSADLFALSKRGANFAGRITVALMARLRSLLASDEGDVEVELHFATDEAGCRYVAGSARGSVELQCQRCLERMVYPLDHTFSLALIRSQEEEQQVPAHYEPLIVESEAVSLLELVEDELILALPIIARHAEGSCSLAVASDNARVVTGAEEGKRRPFAVLVGLKSDNSKPSSK
ncbi:MAG: hypothetical protein FD130_3 [Halothiobacillaceae bacterium]|nr:MAG: hypothetical protein FD130_3 [Halothiobacillaceae bacterium]